MMRWVFILAGLAVLCGPPVARSVAAAEAAVPLAGSQVVEGLSPAEQARLIQRLQREQFVLAGDMRLKGPLIVVIALSHGVPWRLVIDRPTGDIIGRRALGETAAYQR